VAKPNHTHQYALYKKRSRKHKNPDTGYIPFEARYFECKLPKCTHYIEASRLVGKASLCNGCGQEFLLSRDDLERVEPKCLHCSKTKKGAAASTAKSILDNLLAGLQDVPDGRGED
jgi:hypothetical protein